VSRSTRTRSTGRRAATRSSSPRPWPVARAGSRPRCGTRCWPGPLDAAAVIGYQAEPWLLAALGGDKPAAAEECIAIGMLRTQGDLLAFRHELAREAILDTISPPRRRALHALALRGLASPPTGAPDLARLAHHAEGAEDTAAVLAHAPAAAA